MTSENPWLRIPVEDYEGHMSHEKVGQLQALNIIFKSVLNLSQGKKICVLGCTSGNGFEYIDTDKVEKVVGIDINSEYLNVLEKRYGSRIPNLKLICDDIIKVKIPAKSFDLIHGALIFEYVDYVKILIKITKWLKIKGMLAIVLQLPDESPPVSESPYESLELLSPVINLIEPESFCSAAKEVGLKKISGYEYDLNTGKKFFVGYFKKL